MTIRDELETIRQALRENAQRMTCLFEGLGVDASRRLALGYSELGGIAGDIDLILSTAEPAILDGAPAAIGVPPIPPARQAVTSGIDYIRSLAFTSAEERVA